MLSSDFIGVTRKLLEEKYSCKVMITQGASGNVKPKYDRTLEALDKMAFVIKVAVHSCIDNLIPQRIKRFSMISEEEILNNEKSIYLSI